MQNVFLELVKLSLIGSLFAVAVMLVRFVFRKAPKWLFCVLWGVVALRLICPVSIESNVSLVPDRLATGQIITNVGNEYIGDVDIIYESNAGYSNAIEAGRQPIYSNDGYYVVTERDSLEAPKTVGETVYPSLSWVWLAGMTLMLAYTAVSYLLLRKRMEEATHLRDNIWQCEQVDSPFVLGFIKPRIYLPYAITDTDMANVIAHERSHIQRKDHWWKPIGFLLLSIHWFNPVLWLAYILLCRDIEAACDEKVIKHMEKDEMRAYSTALLHCSAHRRRIAACPLAFGEVGVKERIKRVMNYKKPAFWIVFLALAVAVVTCILFSTSPASQNTTLMGAYYRPIELLYTNKQGEVKIYGQFCVTADYWFYAKQEREEEWSFAQQMEKYPLTVEELKEYTFYDKGWHRNYRIREITDAYILRTEDAHFFLVVQTKNGDTLLGYGLEDFGERGQDYSDDTCLEYLYRLESEFSDNGFNTDFFSLSLQNSVGETDCFYAYRNDKNPGFVVVGFMADPEEEVAHGYNDMGFAVFQSQNNGYRLLSHHVYDDAANQNKGILFCDDPAVLSLDGILDSDVTFDVILSCNDKLDKIQREYYKDDVLSKQIASTYLGGGKSMTLFRWDEMDESNQTIKQYYLDSEGNEIGFEEYGEAVDFENLMTMIEDIAHNPDCAASSNPFDFIEAKKALYNEIISYGSTAVDFFVEQLRAGENGLQGYIMAVACADITGIGDKDLGADWATAQEWLALYDKSISNISSIHSQIYAVKEVTYESGVYSFTIVAGENAPFYVLTEDMVLASQKEISEEGTWANLGKMETIELSQENFDNLFKHPGSWADNADASSIRANTEKAWKLIYNQDVLYYILQQKNGDLYLAFGYQAPDPNADPGSFTEHFRWLFKLTMDTTGMSGMVAKSGDSAVPMLSFPKGTMIKDYVGSIYWLTIDPGDEEFAPFTVWEDGEEIRGSYTAYDAVTFEPLKHFIPSGLDPQTYLFQNADPTRGYIVLATFSTEPDAEIYAFGAKFHQDSTSTSTEAITVEQEQPLTIVSNGEKIKPYVHFAYSGSWNGTGFLCADGVDVVAVLPQLETDGQIPRAEYSGDFDVVLGDNATISHILLFDEKFNPLDTVWDIADLSKLASGNYYVGIVVNEEGDYIEEVNEKEYTGWVGVVRLSVERAMVWDWAQEIKRADITYATPWSEGKTFEALNKAESRDLVMLLNKLTKDCFTENKELTGGTPAFGVEIVIDSEFYYVNEYNGPNGRLELVSYNGKQWIIDDADLFAFIQEITGNVTSE